MLRYLLFEEVHVCRKDSDVAVSEICQTAERAFGKSEKDPAVVENITSCMSDSPPPPNITTCSYELSWFPSWLWR